MTAASRPRTAWWRLHPITAVVAQCMLLACGCAWSADESSWKLAKGITGADSGKAASIVYADDAGSASASTSAALLWRLSREPEGARFANSFGASLGYSKNTLSKKRSELVQLGGNARSIVAVSDDAQSNLVANLDLLYEDDRENRARGNVAVLDVALISSRLHLSPELEEGKREKGFDTWLYPSVGFYRREVSSSSSPAATPEGSRAGSYVTLRLTSVFLVLGEKSTLFDRLSADISGTWIRESSVSGGYVPSSYRFAEASVSYLLYGSARGKGWKPSISVTRSKGTDRVGNEPYVDKTEIGFKVSYGI